MIPGWKIRRELTRLGQQLRGIPEAVTEPIAQAFHDRVAFPRLKHRDGAAPLGGKVALYLVFQPGGIAESSVYTASFLAGKGYSVLLVSNAPLREEDRQRLAPHVWRFIERPNYGYDFGGYRDGIRLLWRWGVAPETLVVLNDSVWFPLDPDTRVIEEAETHPADITGSILRVRGEERFLESYFYRIRGRLMSAPAFHDYWENLGLTSNKYKVIRRGERGFSRAMIAAGHTVSALYPNEGLPAHLAGADEGFLREMLRYAAYIDADLAAERDRLLSGSGDDWRDEVIGHVTRTLVKRQAYSSFPVAMVRLFGYPFLKKSGEPVSREWRRAYKAALGDGVLSPPPPALMDALGERP